MVKLTKGMQLSAIYVGTPVTDVSASKVPSAFLQMLIWSGATKVGATVS